MVESKHFAAPGNGAIGDMLRQRKLALRTVQATNKLRTRGETLSSWSPRAALYKKRRALRQELTGSSRTGAAERKENRPKDEGDAPMETAADEKRPRARWFSGLLDSPNSSATKHASSSRKPSSEPSDDSPKVRRVIHGVLQSPGEIHLSDAAKKARRQLTRIRSLTSDDCESSMDEPVFCGQTAAVSRGALFSAQLDADMPDGAIMCADLGKVLREQRTATTEQPHTKTDKQVAADVAASAVAKLFTNAISNAMEKCEL